MSLKPRASYNPEERERQRDHRKVIDLPVVGYGPMWYDGTEAPSPPPLPVGAKVDVLLNDGRVVRTVVRVAPCCGAVWLHGIQGSTRITRVRAPDGWAPHYASDTP